MKRILLRTDGSIFSQSSYRYAAWLASRLDASIEVLYVTDIRSQKVATTGNFSGSIGIDASKELLNKLVDLEHEKAKLNHHRAKLILQDAEQFFATQKLSNVKFTHHTGFLVDSFQEFEAQADLVMLGSLGKEFTAPAPGIAAFVWQQTDYQLPAIDFAFNNSSIALSNSPVVKGLDNKVLTPLPKLGVT